MLLAERANERTNEQINKFIQKINIEIEALDEESFKEEKAGFGKRTSSILREIKRFFDFRFFSQIFSLLGADAHKKKPRNSLKQAHRQAIADYHKRSVGLAEKERKIWLNPGSPASSSSASPTSSSLLYKNSASQKTKQITQSLLRVSELVSSGLKHTDATMTKLDQSSETLRRTLDEYRHFGSRAVVGKSASLITEAKREARKDTIIYTACFAVFLAVVIYILIQRVPFGFFLYLLTLPFSFISFIWSLFSSATSSKAVETAAASISQK